MSAHAGAFRFSQGTSVKLTYSEQDPTGGGDESEDFFASVGHKWGANAVSVSYGNTDMASGAEGTRYGIGWQHEIKKPGITLYAGYHHFENEMAGGGDAEDFDIFRIGSRIQCK